MRSSYVEHKLFEFSPFPILIHQNYFNNLLNFRKFASWLVIILIWKIHDENYSCFFTISGKVHKKIILFKSLFWKKPTFNELLLCAKYYLETIPAQLKLTLLVHWYDSLKKSLWHFRIENGAAEGLCLVMSENLRQKSDFIPREYSSIAHFLNPTLWPGKIGCWECCMEQQSHVGCLRVPHCC